MITIDGIVHSIINLNLPQYHNNDHVLVTNILRKYDQYLETTLDTLRSLPDPHKPTIKEIKQIQYLCAYQHRDIYKSLLEQLKLQKLQHIL